MDADQLAEFARMRDEMMADPRFRAFLADRDEEMAVVAGIVAARKAAGLSQAALAARIGSTQSAVARMEAGRASPRLDTLRRIARATGHRLWVEFLPEELGGYDMAG